MKRIYQTLVALLMLGTWTSCEYDNYEAQEGSLSPVIAIQDIRHLYKGEDVVLTRQNMKEAYQVRGTVISDYANGNVVPGTIVLQSFKKGLTKGITLHLGDAAANFALGDSLLVENIENAVLTKVNGALQLRGINPGSITKVATNRPVTPINVTAYLLDSLPENYEATLVRVYAGAIKPNPSVTDTYTGLKALTDGTDTIDLNTEPSATFATATLPASATFTGIAMPFAASPADAPKARLWPRNLNDMVDVGGPIYEGFPETFEGPTKTSYTSPATLDLKTGKWRFTQALLGPTAGRDRFSLPGLQAVRFQQNLSSAAYLQMEFNVLNGASKVSFSYGAYYTDASSTFRLEYSTDDGKTWKAYGPNITDANSVAKTITYTMDIPGKVRFRINKLGLGTTNNTSINNGRLNIDDFAVYEKM
ncbi:DUF5689 domain-containing protein [Rufibacter immobilis]|nr:DUF5689 domain-containing protein [Rufibacter immobilis]